MKNMKLEWKRGDWAAYFGLMTNNLTNLLTMMGLLIFVVGIPKEIVYGRIAPAFGLAVLVASLCYTWFGLQMARATGRTDVTALPSGPSAPSIFTVTFLVLMPVYQQTGDADFAIQIGLVWCFVEAMILAGGSFLGETIRKMIPRTVLLSCLSGLGLLLLAMNPMLQAFEAPTVSFIVLLLIFINWFGKKPIFAKIPTGLLLLIAGTLLAWISGLQSPDAIKASMSSFGFNPPEVHVDSFMQGLPHALPYLASAVPLGLANYIFDLENIESAHAAGDEYPTRKVMLANGLASMLGCLMGNPFPVTVYVGHPGWKAMGASIGYTLASGVTMFIVPLFGLGAFMLAIIPMTAIVPILVFIGVVTANQVVRGNPESGGTRHLHLPVPVDRQLGADHDEQRDERGGDQRGENRHRRAAQQGDLLRRPDASRQRRAARQHALGLYRHLRHPQQTAAWGRRGGRWSAAGAVWGDPRAGGGLCRGQFPDVRHGLPDDGRDVCGEACAGYLC